MQNQHFEHPYGFPLAWSEEGTPFVPPSNAAVWRVRRVRSGWDGFDVVTWRHPHLKEWIPLVLRLEATEAELKRAVGEIEGLYRVDPVAKDGAVLAGTAGYIAVESVQGWYSSDPEETVYRNHYYRRCSL